MIRKIQAEHSPAAGTPVAGCANALLRRVPADQERTNNGNSSHPGILIMNADDWGRDKVTTDHIYDCVRCATVSSVSAMAFMADSERAAEIARERGIDAGLHLNFTTRFSAPHVSSQLMEHQQKIAAYLLRWKFNKVFFRPGLANSFEYVVAAQLEEYCRLYGTTPERFDGHHHMHLCANMLQAELLPAGTYVRRNFSFQPGEKSLVNRLYRKAVDRRLARRHRQVDFLFSLRPLQSPGRLQRIFALASESAVEVEAHPVLPDEHNFLLGNEIVRLTANIRVSPFSAISGSGPSDGCSSYILRPGSID